MRKIFPCILIFSIFILDFIFGSSHVVEAALAGYTHRKQITVQAANVDADLTDFPLYIFINADADIGANMQDTVNYFDIRFTDALDNVLDYEEETMNIAGGLATGHYFVKTDIDDATGATLYVYYGKTGDTDGSDAANVWSSNFVEVLHLDESPANGVAGHIDSTGNARNGTPTLFDGDASSNTNAVGNINGADLFDGVNDYVTIASDAVFNHTNQDFSVSFWVNFNRINNGHMFGKRNYILGIWGGRLNLMANCAGGCAFDQLGTATYVITTWYHIGLSRNGGASTVDIYRNGVLDRQFAGYPTITASADALNIGQDVGWEFGGIIDEFRMSSVTRTVEWFKFEYENVNQADNELTWGAQELNTTASTTTLVDSAGSGTTTYKLGSSTTGKIYISVTDADENSNTGSAETISATISSSLTNDSESVTLTETGVNTGVFNNLSTGLVLNADNARSTNNAILETRANAIITASYTDDDDGSDTSTDTATLDEIENTFSISLDISGGVAKPGDILSATLTITNNTSSIIQNANATVTLPMGIAYVENSCTSSDNISISSIDSSNRVNRFVIASMAGNQEASISFDLAIGANAQEGKVYEVHFRMDS